MKKTIYLFLAAILLTGIASAQDYKDDPKYGPDPESREQNVRIFSFFNDAIAAKDYDHASILLQELLAKIPKVSENIYIKGAQIYKNKIAKATTKEQRILYMDSLLWLHDKRIEAFGDHAERGEGYIRGMKVRDMQQYNMADKERLFQLYREAIVEGKFKIDEDLIVTFFSNLVESYKLDDVSPEQLVAEYDKLNRMLETSESDRAQDAKSVLEQLFVSTDAANCETIEKIFRPQYEADPENTELIAKIIGMLQRGNCSSDFQLVLVEKYYKTNPKPEVAAQLASFYEGKKDYDKALEYFKVAIDNEADPARKVSYLIRAAGAQLSSNRYRETAALAQQAIALDPNSGYAYLFLANAYAGGAGSACSDFDRQTAYWLIVDILQKAKANLSSDPTQVDNVNNMIGSYAANFPKTEETFMRELQPGQSYTVKCGWISGSTTVRER